MANKKFHIVMTEEDHRELKALAAKDGLTIGETIQTMMDFVLGRYKLRLKEIEKEGVDFTGAGILGTALMDHFAFKTLMRMSVDQKRIDAGGVA